MVRLEGSLWGLKSLPTCPRCGKRVELGMEYRSGWGRLPRPVLVVRCSDPYRCGYSTRPDGRVEKVAAEHWRNCGMAWPEDALARISGDGPEMIVPVKEALEGGGHDHGAG